MIEQGRIKTRKHSGLDHSLPATQALEPNEQLQYFFVAEKEVDTSIYGIGDLLFSV